MKRILSLTLILSLILNTMAYATIDLISISDDMATIGQAVDGAVYNNGNDERTGNESLIQLITGMVESSLLSNYLFDNLEEAKKEMIGDLLTIIYLTDFSTTEVKNITHFFTYHLSQGNESDLLYIFAGAFLGHKDFRYFRERIFNTVSMMGVKGDNYVKSATRYIKVLKDTPTLNHFVEENLDIVSALESKIRTLSYLGQEDYYQALLENSMVRKEGYRNESMALRSFLEAESYFTPQEDDSFWKGFLTAIVPIQRPWPGRGIDGGFMNNASGRAHSLAFDITDILMRHYISAGQDDKVYHFIEDEGLRQGSFYFQFAIDGLALANAYYFSLEDEESRQDQWEKWEDYFIRTFKSESPLAQRVLVTLSRTSQITLEYYALGKIFKFAGKRVISPFAKFCFHLFPKNVQLRFLAKSYFVRGWLRNGMRKYLHDTPRYLFRKIVGGRIVAADPKNIGVIKTFIKESLKRAGYTEDMQIYQFFKTLVFNAGDDVTYNYLRNTTSYLSKEELENFYRLYMRIPSKYKTAGAFVKIRVINNTIVPEIEKPIVSNVGQILANIRDLLKKGGRVVTAELGSDGKIYSRIKLENGTVLRFGKHEVASGKLHVHFEKEIVMDGSTYILNKSFVVNTEESLIALATDDFRNLWRLSTKAEQNGFISALYSAAKSETRVGAAAQAKRMFTDKMRQYAYRLYECFVEQDEAKRIEAIGKLMQLTGKTTEQEAIDETLNRVLSTVSNPSYEGLYGIYKRNLLDKTTVRMSSYMTNEEAADLLQMAITENVQNPTFRGLSTMFVGVTKGAKSGASATPWR